MTTEIKPTGLCFCGCQTRVSKGAYFVQAHVRAAEAALIAVRYGGSLPQLLHHHGFDSHNSVRDAALEEADWIMCDTCEYSGTLANVKKHADATGH